MIRQVQGILVETVGGKYVFQKETLEVGIFTVFVPDLFLFFF